MTIKAKLTAAAIVAVAATPSFAGSLAAPVMEEQVFAPAAATAMPAPVMEEATWEGFYAGLSVGNTTQDGIDGEGLDVGLHAGYNKDLGDFVVGGEFAFAPMAIDLDDDAGEIKNSFSLKAKAGYDMGSLLPYATVGMKNTTLDLAGGEESATGLTYGVGVDYKLSKNIILGGEISQAKFDDFADTGEDLKQTTFGAKVSFAF